MDSDVKRFITSTRPDAELGEVWLQLTQVADENGRPQEIFMGPYDNRDEATHVSEMIRGANSVVRFLDDESRVIGNRDIPNGQ